MIKKTVIILLIFGIPFLLSLLASSSLKAQLSDLNLDPKLKVTQKTVDFFVQFAEIIKNSTDSLGDETRNKIRTMWDKSGISEEEFQVCLLRIALYLHSKEDPSFIDSLSEEEKNFLPNKTEAGIIDKNQQKLMAALEIITRNFGSN
ncbi:MAG: hypothetical protein LBF22_01725 [Deltaproteobacteria bacterium]|jgi:hypothetical protein|nr:hypothetical protein [Deltaproteobacteria bacterium]